MGDFQNDPWPGPTGTGSEPVSPARSLKKKFREAPPVYFMPRYSMPVTVAKYSALAFAGLGIGMVIEGWIKRKVQGLSS
eukprot:jgi/Mesen1/7072/ME000369S06396